MMQATILTIGTWGDLFPYLALGQALQRAGLSVTVATYAYYSGEVISCGLNFHQLPGDPVKLMHSRSTAAIMAAGQDHTRYRAALAEQIEEVRAEARRFFDACLDACRGADAVIYGLTTLMGGSIAEALRVPGIRAFLTVVTPTSQFASFLEARDSGDPLVNLESHRRAEWTLTEAALPILNNWRREALNLPPLPPAGPLRRPDERKEPLLYGCPRTLISRPLEWGPWVHVTGAWYPDVPADWRPSTELDAFLTVGPRPVVVGFSSVVAEVSAHLNRVVDIVVARSRHRFILLRGWSGDFDAEQSDRTFIADFIPHAWLFDRSRVATVVHAGGAGTAAEQVRAGLPGVVIPQVTDSYFWARRLAAVGLADVLGPPAEIGAAPLEAAIERSVDCDLRRLPPPEDTGGAARAADLVLETLDRRR